MQRIYACHGVVSYNGLFNLTMVPPTSDHAVCLLWNKNFGLTPLGQTVVYVELQGLAKIYTRVQKYPITPWDRHRKKTLGLPC